MTTINAYDPEKAAEHEARQAATAKALQAAKPAQPDKAVGNPKVTAVIAFCQTTFVIWVIWLVVSFLARLVEVIL